MNKITLQIENLKCNGCASTVRKSLMKFREVEKVEVDIERFSVDIFFNGSEEHILEYKTKLARLGYPEKGNNSALSAARSYVSCAIGRMGE